MSDDTYQSALDSATVEGALAPHIIGEEVSAERVQGEPRSNTEPEVVLVEAAAAPENGSTNPEEQKEEDSKTHSSVEVAETALEPDPVPIAIYTSAAAEQPMAAATVAPGAEQLNTTEETTLVMSTIEEPVQSYARLEGENLRYYIRSLQVNMGRKASNNDEVDLHLGDAKSISRQHARLVYNFLSQRFELTVLGKNGAFVDGVYVEKNNTVGLTHKSKIQICGVSFYFIVPKMDVRTEESHTEQTTLVPEDNHIASMMSTAPSTASLATSSPMEREMLSVAPSAITADQISAVTPTQPPPPTEIYSKDQKPPFSYATLIAQAINSTPAKKITLNGIYTYISSHYPYYNMSQNGWQNSIRHNLSLNKAFFKVPRGDHEPGKGAFWTIDPNHESQFSGSGYKKSRRSTPRSATSRQAGVPVAVATPTPAPYTPDPHIRHSVDTG